MYVCYAVLVTEIRSPCFSRWSLSLLDDDTAEVLLTGQLLKQASPLEVTKVKLPPGMQFVYPPSLVVSSPTPRWREAQHPMPL